MKTYVGEADGRTVRVTGGAVDSPLDPRLDLRNHSPDGFAWGYSGSGPAQLALAILADHLGDGEAACGLYQRFKRDEVAILDTDRAWTMTGAAIDAWLDEVGYVREPLITAAQSEAIRQELDDAGLIDPELAAARGQPAPARRGQA